jgi:hypothetical protein
MRRIIFILMILSLSGCNKNYYNLKELKHEKIKFNDLPKDIKIYLKNQSDYQLDIQSMLVELPINKKKNYSLETINTLIGPWVSYEKLLDKENNLFYKIDQGTPSPYIVFKNKLYIPKMFNIYTTLDDFNIVEFTCYYLK